MSEHTYKMQVNILMAQVKQLELSLTGVRRINDRLEFQREKLIGALEPFAEINIDLATKIVLGGAFAQLVLQARVVLAKVKDKE